jgi:hypothetical protein
MVVSMLGPAPGAVGRIGFACGLNRTVSGAVDADEPGTPFDIFEPLEG